MGGVLGLVLLPFLLFGARMEGWTAEFLRTGAERPGAVAGLVALLLAGDLFLPVPSSLVGTAAGYFLGFVGGTLVSLLGMTLGCGVAYALGSRSGRPLALRLVGDREMERLERLRERFGDWMLVVARPVPVLAEASVLLAGIGRMPPRRFFLLTTLSNLGISAAYAAIGRFSATADSFLLAFAGAVLVPLVAMLALRGRSHRAGG